MIKIIIIIQFIKVNIIPYIYYYNNYNNIKIKNDLQLNYGSKLKFDITALKKNRNYKNYLQMTYEYE